MLKTFKWILIMATLVVAIIFAVLNYHAVPLNYLVGNNQISLSVLLFAVFLAGLAFGMSLGGWVLMRQRSQLRELHKSVKTMEEELANLRKMPLKGFGG